MLNLNLLEFLTVLYKHNFTRMSRPTPIHYDHMLYSQPLEYTHDPEVASKFISNLSQTDKAVLQVIDAPYDGSTPQRRAQLSLSDDINEGLRNLPPHSIGIARIFEVTVHSDFIITGLRDAKGPKTTRPARDVLIKFLQDTCTQPFEERRIFR